MDNVAKIAEALAKRDKAVAPCPYDKPRPPSSEMDCPKCGADDMEPCRLKVSADAQFVEAVRQNIKDTAQ